MDRHGALISQIGQDVSGFVVFLRMEKNFRPQQFRWRGRAFQSPGVPLGYVVAFEAGTQNRVARGQKKPSLQRILAVASDLCGPHEAQEARAQTAVHIEDRKSVV